MKTGPRLAALFALLVSWLNSRLDSLVVAMKGVLNVETYLHCSQDLRGTQHGLWPGAHVSRGALLKGGRDFLCVLPYNIRQEDPDMDNLTAVPSRVAQLAAAFSRPEPIRRGSLYERRMKCGQAACACQHDPQAAHGPYFTLDRKSTRLNSSHSQISYAVFCLKKKKQPLSHSLHQPPLTLPQH